MAPPRRPCCDKLAEVLRGPGNGAEPTLFVDDEGELTMVIGMVDTPGGLGLFDHAVRFCPFCGARVAPKDNPKAID